MTYMILLESLGGYFEESILEFWPPHVFDLMEANFVDDNMGICKGCEMACHCHVLVPIPNIAGCDSYKKLCTVLFHDLVKPQWRLEDVA